MYPLQYCIEAIQNPNGPDSQSVRERANHAERLGQLQLITHILAHPGNRAS